MTVEIHPKTGPFFEIKALLDSGAAISHFDKALWPQLGIADIRAGIPIEVTSASQGRSRKPDEEPDVGYIHDIDVTIFGRTLTIPVVLCPTWAEGTPNLLGMEGVFDRWRFAFDHDMRRLYYSAV